MEDDDDSLPRATPPPPITVTVAAVPPMAAQNMTPPPATPTPLTLALPIQQTPSGGREDCWSEGATSVLIDAWGERYMELSRGNLKQKHWQEVADIVSARDEYSKTAKTDIQCKNRIDTVKKKFKIEKAKVATGCGPSRWAFFERLDRLIGPSSALPGAGSSGSAPAKASGNGVGGGSGINSALQSHSPALGNSQKAVPMGIPVGVRQHQQPLSLPFAPYNNNNNNSQMHTPPPHLRQNFAIPPSQQQRFNQSQNQMQNYGPAGGFNPNVNASRYGNNAGMGSGNAGSSGRQQMMYQQQQMRRGAMVPVPVDSDSEEGEEWLHDSGDDFPPERRKRPRAEMMGVNKSGNVGGGKRGKGKKKEVRMWGSSVRELTRAILKFGEAYEAAESAKLQHIVEMEKQRMKFAKELELQRMKFMMKTQLELSQLNENENGDGSGSADANGNSDSRGGGSSGRRGGMGGAAENNHLSHLSHLHENHVNHANSDSSN